MILRRKTMSPPYKGFIAKPTYVQNVDRQKFKNDFVKL